MARYYGNVGYSIQEEIRPGVYEDVIVEKTYYGSVERDAAKWNDSVTIHKDLSVSNVIEIVADAYALDHIYAMKFVEWAGAKWLISGVEVIRPRIKLRLGGIYRGPGA